MGETYAGREMVASGTAPRGVRYDVPERHAGAPRRMRYRCGVIRSPAPGDVPGFTVPDAELVFRASRAGGPGGQHVNTSSTRVEVVWDVAGSPSLDEAIRARLLTRLETRLDSEGRLRVVASGSRSQLRNREDATARLKEVVRRALAERKPRKRTRPPAAAKAQRLDRKRRRGALKRTRRPARHDED
ncbi:MAG TPA: alternative ribosome rescue aminoacyl-tRNA hydrolase ArfB [Gemmatimonadales bacterium]|nr:alternative ribosome rescue aminoacyl-tRNA hydrolase ArfB [Gemmatimonadales bacterium]